MLRGALRRWRVLAPLRPKKSRSKRPSKTHQILMPCQYRFLSVLALFWRAKMAPKSIKNRSKSSFQAFLFPHRFLHRFFIDFWSQLRPAGSPKIGCFSKRKQKSKTHLSKITSISASMLVPTCLHVGLPNRRCFEIMAFQETFKISSFFASIFFIDFGSVLGSNMGLSWGPRRL